MTDTNKANEQNAPLAANAANATNAAPKAHEHSQAQTKQNQSVNSEKRAASQPRKPGEENTIFIGRKSTMGYVLAVVTQFNSGASEVKVKARGKLISKAVDVAEITRGRFISTLKTKDIKIMTEEVQNEDGSKSKISSMEIILQK